MESIRKASSQEKGLIELLMRRASIDFPSDWSQDLLVQPMDDGGMGSLLLFPYGEVKKDRLLGKRVSEYEFTDRDEIEVIASLNIDSEGNLFELDIWKTDFSPLIGIPDELVY